MLSKNCRKALKMMPLAETFTVDLFSGVFDDTQVRKETIDYLVENDYIVKELRDIVDETGIYRDWFEGKYRLGVMGKQYREERASIWIRKWWPLILSTIALIKSFMPEIISGTQLLLRWLK